MNDNKIIAQVLLEIAKNSTTELIEDAKIDNEIKSAAKQMGLILPSPDFAVFKTKWADIDKANLNKVRLPRKAVEEGIQTLVGKNLNFEHLGAYNVCGFCLSVKIKKDEIESINVFYKSLYPDKFEELKEKIKTKEAAVSFEIWNIDPSTKKSVVKELENGIKEITKIICHGTGLLLVNPPACPTAKVFHLEAKKEIEDAEKIANRVFNENLIYAELAIEKTEDASYDCECLKCGKIVSSDKHCKDIKCPECGGEMRRKDRPGKGQPTEKSEKEDNKVELSELFANVTKEEEITFDLAMAFYYASDEEQVKLTEDAAKWTRKFINGLPDSAFAAIEPAYPEKTDNKNARHLPHHNGEGDLGKDKSNDNLDLSHYKNALARANQIKPISDSISAEDLQKKASAHLERHKDALKTSAEETKAEVKPEETQAQDAPKVDAQKEQKPEENPAAAETKPEIKAEETKVENKENAAPEKAQDVKITEPKVVVKVTRIYSDMYVDTYKDGSKAGTSEGKSYVKTVTEYADGTKDEVESEAEFKTKFDYAEVEAKVNEAKAEAQKTIDAKDEEIKNLTEAKDKEIANLKQELGNKDQEIAKLNSPAEPEKDKNLEVGNTTIDGQDEIKIAKAKINEIIASKHKK